MPKRIEISGQRFGRLVVIGLKPVRVEPFKVERWKCLCDCGAIKFVQSGDLRSGHTRSCKCLLKEGLSATSKTHGHTIGGNTQTYRVWLNMRQRCANPNNPKFGSYGARGITVCERWNLFENFLADMGEAPAGLTIERIDNDRWYSPENCRWATMTEQCNNRRNNIRIPINGEIKLAAEWGKLTGIPVTVIYDRLRLGWDPVRAVTQRVQRHRSPGARTAKKQTPFCEPEHRI